MTEKSRLLGAKLAEADAALMMLSTLLKGSLLGSRGAQFQLIKTARDALSEARTHGRNARKAAQTILDTL